MENSKSDRPAEAQPFVKWVGGKRQLAAEIVRIAGVEGDKHGIKGYIEPFLGGGAMFYYMKQQGMLDCAIASGKVELSDVNRPLMECYLAVRSKLEALLASLEKHKVAHYEDLTLASTMDMGRSDRGGEMVARGARSKLYGYYLAVRSDYNKLKQEFTGDSEPAVSDDGLRLAAMFLYLNRAGFNGMYRENSKGEMNIPPGRYAKPELVNAEVLHACSAALQGVQLHVRGFEAALSQAGAGDLVYLDPPYFETFTAYSKGGFDYEAQKRLAETASAAAGRGAKVIISNSDTEEMRNLYQDKGFEVGELKAARNINSDGTGRAKVTEIVAFNSLS